jgi:hypothetical protein
MLARRRIRREDWHHTALRHPESTPPQLLLWCDNVPMPKRRPKQPKKSQQVSKLPADASADPAGPRLLPLADDRRRKHEIHPQIDSFVELADNALRLWDKKKT